MKFTTILLLIAIALYGAGWAIPPFQAFAATWMWPTIVAGYGALTYFLHRWIVRAAGGTSNAFVAAVNGSTAAKMMLSMVVVASYLISKAPFRIEFSFGLFTVFMVNTIALVLSSQRVVRSK